jgi:methyltransferase (TIGR00027 family)
MEDGGPSQTARRVAAHRLDFTRIPADYGDPAADQALAVDVAAGHRAPPGRMHDYLAARTSFFDRTVTGALGRGVRQVVVGAAGYDGRAFRYAKPGVRWFEVDHPATQRDKLRRLERLGIAASHVRFVEADFTRDPVADRLRASGLDPDVPALFLLEGIAVYLEPAVLESVLGQFRQVAGPGSRLAISVSRSRPRDDGARARFQAAVAALGEPARSTFEAGEAEALLARTGWRTAAVPDDGPQAAARRERLRAAGLLLASAGPAPTDRPQPPRGTLPLSALLSQALIAFTIEFDNEAEHRLPHRTTSHGRSGHGDGDATWLVSLAMWENCMRYVTGEPITVADLEARARTRTNLDGMRRWGYVTIDGTATKVHSGRPGPDAVLRATAAGLRAREIWRPLAGHVEQRWRERFGADQVAGLRDPLIGMVSRLDPGLPDCLPILGADLRSRGPGAGLRACLGPLAVGDPPPLFAGLEPYPDNWRASARPLVTLPHFPMVLHRGCYPDGS